MLVFLLLGMAYKTCKTDHRVTEESYKESIYSELQRAH